MVLDRSAEPNTRLNALLFFGDFSSMRSEIYFFCSKLYSPNGYEKYTGLYPIFSLNIFIDLSISFLKLLQSPPANSPLGPQTDIE